MSLNKFYSLIRYYTKHRKVIAMEIPDPIKTDLEKIGGINSLIKSLPKSKKIENVSKIFHGLSDKFRLKILMTINKQPVCVQPIKNDRKNISNIE